MLSAMVLPIFLLVFPLHTAHAWPCSVENTFEAASYVKTEEELNEKRKLGRNFCGHVCEVSAYACSFFESHNARNLQAYFAVLTDLPQGVGQEHQPDAKVTYHRASVSLDPYVQEVHLKIPLDVSAQDRSYYTMKKVQNNSWCWQSFMSILGSNCSTHKEPQGCDGSGYFRASVVLRASFKLKSRLFRWQPVKKKVHDPSGPCRNLSQIMNYNVSKVTKKLQEAIGKQLQEALGKRWVKVRRHVLKLAFGAQLFLYFSTPRIGEADGTRTISGSILGCVQDSSKQPYVLSQSQRSSQTYCHNRTIFTKYESNKNQQIRLCSRHLVFRWDGSPKVAITIGNQVTATIAEEGSGYIMKLTSHQSSSPKPDLLSWLQRRIWTLLEDISVWWQSQPDTAHRFNYPAQNQEFWLTIVDTDGQQQILLGKGSDVLANKSITARGPLNISLSSLDSNATWQVSLGQTQRVCHHGMPTALTDGHGAVRLSTQLFGAVLGVQAQHFKHYASNATTAIRDAKIHHGLELGDIQLKMMPPEAVSNLSLVSLFVKNSSTETRCDGRTQPLLYASLDRFQASASLTGRKGGEGKLLLSMAFQGSDASSYSLQGTHLWNPRVPVSQAAVQANSMYVFKRLLPDVNTILKTLDLVLPPWLAQFIPCEVQLAQAEGRCLNMRLPQHESSGQGFVEFPAGFSADDQVPEEFWATNPASWVEAVKDWLKRAYAFMQSRPKLTFLLLACVCLAWIGLAWCRAPKYAVSAFLLYILLYSWHAHSPFAGFTVTALSESGAQITSIKCVVADMQNMTLIAMVCTFLELLILPCWVDIFDFFWQLLAKTELACSEKEDIAYWCFSALVLRSQVWLLVDMPLVYFLGRKLGAEIEADSAKLFPSSPLHVVEVAFNLKASQIHHMTGTMISCSFTSMFVSFIGMYLIYFLLALPVGIFLGAVAFVVIDGPDHWSPRVSNTTALCLLITELLSTASILGPFIIAYQILGGTTQWWLAAGLMGVCRPLFAVPYTKSEMFASKACAIMIGLAYVGISLVGGILLWKSYNGALDRRNSFSSDTGGSAALVGRLSNFTFAIYATSVWFLSSSAYRLLCDVGYAKRAGSKLAGQIEKTVSAEWWSKVSTVFECVERKSEIPFIEKLLHKRWISHQTLQALWENFVFPWLIWLLEMDALVSFLYHFCKVCQLGIATGFFKSMIHWPMLLFAWLSESDQHFQQDLKQAPQVVLNTVSFGRYSAISVFLVCCLASWMVLLYAHAGKGPGRLRRTGDMCKMRLLRLVACRRFQVPREGTSQSRSLEEPLMDGRLEEEEDSEAISNFARSCLVQPEIARVELRWSWAGLHGWAAVPAVPPTEEGEYRKEFLLFGLLHGLLGFARDLLRRESFPHTWGILGSEVAKQRGLRLFHDYLRHKNWEVDGAHTALDEPFLTFDWHMSLSSVLQAVLWILVFASLLGELHNQKTMSQMYSFLAGAVAVASGLSVLVPNYARLTDFQQFFEGCGPEFDSLMNFTVSGIFGMMFAVPLGLQVFGILLTIPISAVRGLWFVMIRPKMRSNRILHAAMWLVAFLIPFVDLFPLRFCNQLTEDSESQNIIFAFWLFPALTIICAGENKGETWFYFGWLAVYCGLAGYFLYHQSQIMNIGVQQVVRYLDLPWLWSLMHSDFCLTSVIITDLVCLVLGNHKGIEESGENEDEEQHTALEMSKTCIAVSQPALAITDEIRNLPGFQNESVEEGLTMVTFDSETSARAAANQALTHGRLVHSSSLFRPVNSH